MRYAKAVMSEAAGHDFNHLPPGAAGLGHVFARPKLVAVLCVVVLAVLGWVYLALLLAGMSGSLGGSFGGYAAGMVQALCRPLPDGTWTAGSIAIVASMWSAMTLAMMLPSAAPMIMTYAGIADTAAHKGERIVSPFVLTAGYTVVWLSFSVIATLVQIALTRVALLDAGMASASGLFSGAIFIGAGVYQFSVLKHACLKRCQHPFPFFFANWTTTSQGVFRLGVKQGLYCLGCCWAMMLVMFAVGVMNVLWMVGIGIAMTIEKMLTGRRFTHAVGVVLIVAGAAIIVTAVVNHWPIRSN
jgi:predicted metal-binding membrane protein